MGCHEGRLKICKYGSGTLARICRDFEQVKRPARTEMCRNRDNFNDMTSESFMSCKQ